MNRPLLPPVRSRAGFSLIEMIGVLAIIAILAVAIVPRVFATISNSRLTSTVGSVNSIQSAVADFASKYGTLPVTNANSRIDDLLMSSGYLDNRFKVKVGTQPPNPSVAGAAWTYNAGTWTAAGGASQNGQSRIICLASNATSPSTANGANYHLDGTTSLPAGAFVTSVVLANVTGAQAQAISLAIDGDALSAANATTADAAGKVVYNTPNGQNLTTVYIYLAQQ
ncbi:MAG TPA: prepilin-type N-terminal cleavage/methylation domain-containing protein [Opitutaceae bacterium]|jgi:prepilin-type N-terminal cleavage/methylation domain-containing protein|nr:prepilin-type N-terminal cleavage/methylation domain-containing protein [Opitutaceae bacterium]